MGEIYRQHHTASGRDMKAIELDILCRDSIAQMNWRIQPQALIDDLTEVGEETNILVAGRPIP